jgi:type IV pilus biogenesis protein CpaD/CtpE
MDARTVAAAAALGMALVVTAGCAEADTRTGGSTTTDQQSYEITEPIDALVVDARAATVIVEGGDGPLTVEETQSDSETLLGIGGPWRGS